MVAVEAVAWSVAGMVGMALVGLFGGRTAMAMVMVEMVAVVGLAMVMRVWGWASPVLWSAQPMMTQKDQR